MACSWQNKFEVWGLLKGFDFEKFSFDELVKFETVLKFVISICTIWVQSNTRSWGEMSLILD